MRFEIFPFFEDSIERCLVHQGRPETAIFCTYPHNFSFFAFQTSELGTIESERVKVSASSEN